MNKTLISLLLLLITLHAYAQVDESEFSKCSRIQGELARLSCYDELAKSNDISHPTPQISDSDKHGKWLVTTEANPVDDTQTAIAILTADSGTNKWGKSITFVARCKSNQTEAYINWDDFLGHDASVLTRIGSEKAKTNNWDLSSDYKSTFSRQPVQFLKGMLKSNKLLAQITPYNDNPITAVFDITGFDAAVKPLRELCKW